MSLYHKYRPFTLEEVKGNRKIVSSLKGLLENPDTSSHVFMFHGTTGCGKTTLGRIVGKTLGVSDKDFTEIDSADFRGIDTIREIRKNAQYLPVNSPYRVFLLDEMHQLSKDAQNALLKILEDTPPHVYFILCTTDPQKVLPTVKNRCTQLQVNPLEEIDMKRLLKNVLRKEKEALDKEVLQVIIKEAGGIPRNALQILEQVLSTEEDKRLETAKQVQKETSESIELCRALLANSNWKQVSKILSGLRQQDAEGIRRHVLGYATSVLLKSDNTKAGLVLEEFLEPTYNSGFSQIVFASYSVVKNS